MKKLLFFAMLAVISLASFAQTPTITIDKVVPGEQDGVKGDFVTVTIHSEAASGWSLTFNVDFGKAGKGGAGGYGYPESETMFSRGTTTVTRFCGLLNGYANKERTWTVYYSYIPDDKDSDPYPWTVSDSYTLSRK